MDEPASRRPALFAQRIPSDERYFSSRRYREWAIEVFGPAFTLRQVAERCRVDRNSVRMYLSGERVPGSENLFRMASTAGVSPDRWLQHVVYKSPVAPDGGD